MKKQKDNKALIQIYLSQLIEYKCTHSREVLKLLLSQFHHVLPLCPFDQAPLLCMVVCSALSIDSEVIFQRVLKNVCRLSLRDSCYVVMEIIFSALQKDTIHEAGVNQLKELIQLGLEGNNQDRRKSMLLLQTLLKVTKESNVLIPFLIHIVDILVDTSIINEPTILDQYCDILLHQDRSVIHHICIHCMENLESASELQAYNNTYVLLLLTQKDSLVPISFQYHLLNRITNDLSIYNSNHYLHSLLLRFYSFLVQFIGLEPVFSQNEWIEQYWNQKKGEIQSEKIQYEQYSHSIY